MAVILRLYRALPPAMRALVLMALHTLAVATLHVAVRQASAEGMHAYETSFFRSFIAVLWMVPWFAKRGTAAFRTRKPHLHLTRGAFNVGAMVTLHIAIAIPTPLALIAAVAFTAPLFAGVGAILILGEALKLLRSGALVVGFAGAIAILRPWEGALNIGALWILSHAACWAGALLMTKRMAATESPPVTVAYTMILLTLFTAPMAATVWTWPTPTAMAWLLLVGFLQVSNQLALTQAMREVDATVVMPFDFLRMVWASLYGYAVYSEQPDLLTWIGGLVIFAAATALTINESRSRKKAVRPT